MTDQISLTGVRVVSCHGVLAHEKVEPQPFLADIVLEVDLAAAAASDDLARTVSYAEIAQQTEAILVGPPVDLIETLAERVAQAALAHPPVEAVEVTIRKPQAPAGVSFEEGEQSGPAVSIRRERDLPFVVALGANLGAKERTLAAAVRQLRAVPGIRLLAVSNLVATAPVGGPEQPDYLNAVALGRTRLAAWTVLRHLHQIEADFGREREIHWGARTLDLDLLQYGDPRDGSEVHSDAPDLVLPHARAHERAFVLVPWADADPAAVLTTAAGVRPVRELLPAVDVSGVEPGPEWPR